MVRSHSIILKKVKSFLPRRESERRVHRLAQHCHILSALDTRINMLDTTFMKYIESGVCCFIPGKVIDEILRILKLVEKTDSPPRTHEVLEELRDISSMAMEYFDEKIAPTLQQNRSIIRRVPSLSIPGPSSFNTITPMIVTDTFRNEFRTLQHKILQHNMTLKSMRNVITKLTHKVLKQHKKIHDQSLKIRQQTETINEQNATITELKRHVEEWDLKFTELSTKINRFQESPQNNPPKPQNVTQIRNRSFSPPRLYIKPNIKPRMAQIAPKSIIVNNMIENERKRKSENLLRNPVSVIPTKISRLQKPDENITSNLFPKLPEFLSSSLEILIKNPISSLKSRKRKIQ